MRILRWVLLIVFSVTLLGVSACSTAKSVGHTLKEEAQSLMFWKKRKPYLETDFLEDQDVREINGHEYVRVKNPNYGQRLDAPEFIWVEKEKYLKTYYCVTAPAGKGKKGSKAAAVKQVGSLPPPPPQYLQARTAPPAVQPGVSKAVSTAQAAKTVKPAKNLKRRILLLAFVNNTGEPVDFIVDAVYLAIKKQLLNSDEVILMERDTMDKYLKNKGLTLASLNDKTVLIRAGEAIGAQGFFFGSIDRLMVSHSLTEKGEKEARATINLHINLIDATTASLIKSSVGDNSLYDAEATGDDCRIQSVKLAVQQALKKALPPILKQVRKISWNTRIIKVEGEKIYIDAGRETGLMVGDTLSVYKRGADILIPSTQIVVGRNRGPFIGKIRVIDFFGLDAAIAIPSEGDKFEKGDNVVWGS